jgi:hypothetical protein
MLSGGTEGDTAVRPSRARDGDFDHQPHPKQLLREAMLLDLRTGVGHLWTVADAAPFLLGFCLGGATVLHHKPGAQVEVAILQDLVER